MSGVLLPLFSLRSSTDLGVGDFGALNGFFSWMQAAGQRLLMLLPLLPTAPGDSSPYSTRSAFGLNALYIDLSRLPEHVSLTDDERRVIDEARARATVDYPAVFKVKGAALERAYARYQATDGRGGASEERFQAFCESERDWLETFALYASLSEAQGQKPWWEWEPSLARRESAALMKARLEHASRIRYHAWLQWVAAQQWADVRAQARAAGIVLCGDEPFIVGKDSADCWQFPHLLRSDGRLGVPPDDFSADGQDWGLPWFDFDAMERDGYAWLKARARKAAETYDVRRVDHAIGYFRQWVRDEATPRGRFVPPEEPRQRALGEKHFRLLSEGAGVIAEDLGVIPPFATETLRALSLPGFFVMRWARADGVYQDPRQYPEVSLATTGTHDTESLRASWEGSPLWEREAMVRTFPELAGLSPAGNEFTPAVHEALIAAAENARSNLCVIPWPDVFAESARINHPGTVGDHNWVYRMAWPVEELLNHEAPKAGAAWLRRLSEQGQRL